MPIDEFQIEYYRRWAKGSDLHRLSGRKKKSATAFVNATLTEKLAPQADHRVVDIGCGDGSFITSLSSSECIGIIPTQEECARLRSEYPGRAGLRFAVGLAESIPLKSGCADRVVCNGILRLLSSLDVMELVVAELARIAAKDALVWIGEVTSLNKEARPALLGRRLGRYIYQISTLNMSYTKYSNKEMKYFRKKKPIVMNREMMIGIANRHGLNLVWDGPHLFHDSSKPLFCPVRRNYLFRKVGT